MKELLNNQDRIMNILKMHPKTRCRDSGQNVKKFTGIMQGVI